MQFHPDLSIMSSQLLALGRCSSFHTTSWTQYRLLNTLGSPSSPIYHGINTNCVCESKQISRLPQEKPENMPHQPGGEAYKAFIHPLLEYTCVEWDPRTQKNINRLESIQRHAARFVLNCRCNTSLSFYLCCRGQFLGH